MGKSVWLKHPFTLKLSYVTDTFSLMVQHKVTYTHMKGWWHLSGMYSTSHSKTAGIGFHQLIMSEQLSSLLIIEVLLTDKSMQLNHKMFQSMKPAAPELCEVLCGYWSLMALKRGETKSKPWFHFLSSFAAHKRCFHPFSAKEWKL